MDAVGRGGSHVHASSHKHSIFSLTHILLSLFLSLTPSYSVSINVFLSFSSFSHFHAHTPNLFISPHFILLRFITHSSFPLHYTVYKPTSHYILSSLSLSRTHTEARAGPQHQSVTEDINCHRGNNQRQQQQPAGPSGILCSVCLAL